MGKSLVPLSSTWPQNSVHTAEAGHGQVGRGRGGRRVPPQRRESPEFQTRSSDCFLPQTRGLAKELDIEMLWRVTKRPFLLSLSFWCAVFFAQYLVPHEARKEATKMSQGFQPPSERHRPDVMQIPVA